MRKRKREAEKELKNKKLHMGMDSYKVFAQKTHLSLRYADIHLNSPLVHKTFVSINIAY